MKVRNKAVNTSNSIFEENISLRATGRILELLRPFVLLLRHGYCLLKNIKSKRELVMFEDNKRNRRSCLISKVRHRNLCNEQNFSVTEE